MYSVTSFILTNTTAGLLVLLGLAVPVAIHLWNRRPGRTVQVGSVRWLAASANPRLRNLQLEQVWLLLLRAAVLAVLAVAVAGPFWQRFQAAPPPRGVVLLAPEALRPEVLPALRPSIDSLRKRGAVLRLFAPGFRVISAPAWRNIDSLAQLAVGPGLPTAPTTAPGATRLPAAPDDYWARARQAADSFPNQPLHLITGTARRHFAGPRPALPARLTWQPVPLPDSVVWLAGATLVAPDTLRLLIGSSHGEATTFRVLTCFPPRAGGALAVAGLPTLRYQTAQASQPATVQPVGQAAVLVTTGSLRVMLYTDAAHTEAGRYVRAALRAAAIGLPQRLEIRNASPEVSFAATARPDWLFWLSEKPVPASWQAQTRRGAQLWQEASGAGAVVATELDLTGLATVPPVLISRLDTTTRQPANAATVWQDGTGRPVLTHQPQGAGGRYQLRTRLQPSWSDLPDSPVLPELFLSLLRPLPPTAYARHDERQLDMRQLTGVSPARSTPNTVSDSAAMSADALQNSTLREATRTTDLRPWAVLAALVLFALERRLASRRAVVSSFPAPQ